MNQELNANERELIKLINFFKKRAAQLKLEGKLREEDLKVTEACDNLVEKLTINAKARAITLQNRKDFEGTMKDNATCPKCQKNSMLKLVGARKLEKGWKVNVYKCRRCNIEFNWTQPNNPWDMIPYLEDTKEKFSVLLNKDELPQEVKENSSVVLNQIEEGMQKLKAAVESSDAEFENLQVSETLLSKQLHDFKNYLLIEKIKMDSWNDPTGLS
jgi:RecJ-like exonuclease